MIWLQALNQMLDENLIEYAAACVLGTGRCCGYEKC